MSHHRGSDEGEAESLRLSLGRLSATPAGTCRWPAAPAPARLPLTGQRKWCRLASHPVSRRCADTMRGTREGPSATENQPLRTRVRSSCPPCDAKKRHAGAVFQKAPGSLPDRAAFQKDHGPAPLPLCRPTTLLPLPGSRAAKDVSGPSRLLPELRLLLWLPRRGVRARLRQHGRGVRHVEKCRRHGGDGKAAAAPRAAGDGDQVDAPRDHGGRLRDLWADHRRHHRQQCRLGELLPLQRVRARARRARAPRFRIAGGAGRARAPEQLCGGPARRAARRCACRGCGRAARQAAPPHQRALRYHLQGRRSDS